MSVSSERDKALQDLKNTLVNHEKELSDRYNKGKRITANTYGPPSNYMGSVGGEKDDKEEDQQLTLTKEQYAHMMDLLHHFGGKEGTNNTTLTSGAVNFAGPFTEEAAGNW